MTGKNRRGTVEHCIEELKNDLAAFLAGLFAFNLLNLHQCAARGEHRTR